MPHPGIAVTTFGVDGALVDKQGNLSIRSLAGNVREQQRLWTILTVDLRTAVAGYFWRRSL